MLEVTGFKDQKKKEHDRVTREFSAYEGKGAA
jgi:hypothetical protein